MIKTKNNEILQKRNVTMADLPEMEQLAKAEFFNVGLHNMKLYFECSPDTWYVIVNSAGQIVAYSIFNQLPEIGLCFGFGLVVRKDYRSQGLTRYFDTMHYSKLPSMGNASNDSMKRYKYDVCGEKMLSYYGPVQSGGLEKIRPIKPPTNFTLHQVTANDIDEVVDYDATILLFKRRMFLTEWILAQRYPCKTTALVARSDSDGQVCGYGVLRECDKYFMVSPVYADNEHVAEWLFYSLLEKLSVDDTVFIFFPAKNRLVMQLVTRLNLAYISTDMRESAAGFDKTNMWSIKRIYAMHDYYPF